MTQGVFNPGAAGSAEPVVTGSVGGTSGADLDARQLIEALHELRRSAFGEAYWPRFCSLVAPLARARLACLVDRAAAGEDWKLLAASGPGAASVLETWRDALGELGERAQERGYAYAPMRDAQGGGRICAVVRMGELQDQTLLLLDIADKERSRLNELLLRVQLVAELPRAPAAATLPAAVEAANDAPVAETGDLAGLLDLTAQVMREKKYGVASLALVNGIASRFGGALVALGWRNEGYVKIEAISHLDRFERNTEYINLLEGACEEALDQECDINYVGEHAGEEADTGLVVQAHNRLRRGLGYSQICTLPLQSGLDTPTAVLLIAREEGRLDAASQASLHLGLGLILPWLQGLREGDRWWGARLMTWMRRQVVSLIGPDRPFMKVAGVAITLLLAYGLLGVQNYHIEATSQLGTDSTRLISASYDGFINHVGTSSGELVKEGALLASLDTREQIQQEAEILADMQRYRAEAMKARASLNIADAEIAGRRLAQVEARLKRVRFSLAQSRIHAPFDAVVVEGERKDLLGAPVKKGDRLFRLARIEGLYAVLHVPESEVRYVSARARGELTLLARPDKRIPFEVETLMPVAQVKGQDGNHFVIKARLLQSPETWWRPGMSGMARIDAGERNVAWIYTHKAIDALRLAFWI